MQAVDAAGLVRFRYGGWGTGPEALDMAIALDAGENSIFVLDQGRRSIIWLDLQLNRIAETQLPQDDEPVGFVRDSRRQFWIIMEGRPGLHLFDDQGALLTVIGDQTSGDDGILAPLLIAAYDGLMAVWDDHRQAVCLLSESGAVERWLPIGEVVRPIDLAFTGNAIYILTDEGVMAADITTGERRLHRLEPPVIAIFPKDGQLLTVDSEGTISAFTAQP